MKGGAEGPAEVAKMAPPPAKERERGRKRNGKCSRQVPQLAKEAGEKSNSTKRREVPKLAKLDDYLESR